MVWEGEVCFGGRRQKEDSNSKSRKVQPPFMNEEMEVQREKGRLHPRAARSQSQEAKGWGGGQQKELRARGHRSGRLAWLSSPPQLRQVIRRNIPTGLSGRAVEAPRREQVN